MLDPVVLGFLILRNRHPQTNKYFCESGRGGKMASLPRSVLLEPNTHADWETWTVDCAVLCTGYYCGAWTGRT